ncbi:MAG: class I SAM-dependent methyltransferase [Spirochaetales bacterium]|nr:class I SAM-dependent methyltransferase [Spirochaetales bacterium]
MNHTILQNSYNRSAHNYDSQLAEIQLEKYKIMLNQHQWPSFSRILDIGCGTALLYDFIANNLKSKGMALDSFEYHGIDFSTEMIRMARLKNIPNLITGNMSDLPFKDNSFDQVLSFTAIGLSDDSIDNILDQCYRVLKPKGQLIITVLKRLKPDFMDNLIQKSCFKLIKSSVFCGQDTGFIAKKP